MADRSGIREALAGILKAVSDTPQLLTDRVKQALGGLLERVKGVLGREAPQEPPIEAPTAPIEDAPPQILPTVPPRSPPPPQVPTLTPDMQETIQMLWQLSGGNPGVFQSYLNTFPDSQLQAIASTPQGIGTIANFVMGTPVDYTPSMAGGIPESAIPSSNIFGTEYNPQTGEMLVKFNGKDQKAAGPEYVYSGVDPQTAELVESGAIPARTRGSNKWGEWWPQKSPSMGGSVNSLLVKSGLPYRKVS